MLLTILQGTERPSADNRVAQSVSNALEHSGLWGTSQHLAFFRFLLLHFRRSQFTHLLGFTTSFPLAKVKPFAPVRTFDHSSVESVDQAGGAPLVRVGAHSW